VKNLAIARRYAKALLLIGKEDGQAETYRAELDGFHRLLAAQPELEQAINNPLHDTAARKQVLQAVVARMKLSAVMGTFMLLLFDKGRFRFLSHINDHYQKMADELKGVARASVTSAVALSAEVVEKIRQTLSQRTGKAVLLEVQQDPGLIGGLITRIGDLVLDGSIRTQLLNMRESLKRGEAV
jgi:F-type H+-transporting ATPase subunit delta